MGFLFCYRSLISNRSVRVGRAFRTDGFHRVNPVNPVDGVGEAGDKNL
jgi:hypothetical protein